MRVTRRLEAERSKPRRPFVVAHRSGNSLLALRTAEARGVRTRFAGVYTRLCRGVAFDGTVPNVFGYLALVAFSYAVFIGGYQFFMRYKSVIVDVI